MDETKRLAFITGSAAGLGAGVAERLAELGYRVQLTHRPGGTPPTRTLERVQRFDAEANSSEIDVAQTESWAAVVAEIEAQRGPISLLVHAAGPMQNARFSCSALQDYEEIMRANLGSAVALAFALLPGMRERYFGRLIFFGMTGSAVTRPARGLALYGAAKAGLVAFARTLALEEAAHRITVNIIEPGDIRDKNQSRLQARAMPAKNPTGFAGSWEDVADAVGYLVSDAACFINGAVLAVGGGLVDAHG